VRLFCAFWVFAACLLIGYLAKRISGRRAIGVIVAVMALLTPWFFETRGVLLAPLVSMALASFLVMIYHLQEKECWTWLDAAMLAATLALSAYCYNSGRVLGPLFALGLLSFATSRQRLAGIVKTWLLYGVTLIPILVFNRSHPGALTKRLYEVSYIRPGVPLSDIAFQFIKRYLEDQSLTALLLTGDYHPRHHVQGAGGALFFTTFALALMGLAIIIACRRRDPWWRFALYGLAAAIVPGAISVEPFHQTRLVAYPVFILIMTVPALEWLLAKPAEDSAGLRDRMIKACLPRPARISILFLVLALTAVEAYRFQIVFRRDGPKRLYEFDAPYKTAYDIATKQPARPIYLEDGKWGPAYIHALWYATLEKRPTSEFVHLAAGVKPPAGAIVISAADICEHCEPISHPGVYLVYKTL
jgi:hypothetical protein